MLSNPENRQPPVESVLGLPWWRNHQKKPAGDGSAQSVWILGQWQFIPFAAGVPLRRMCGNLSEAHQELADFKKKIVDAEIIIKKLERSQQFIKINVLRENILEFEDDCKMQVVNPQQSSYSIYIVGDNIVGDVDENELCIIVDENGLIYQLPTSTYAEALLTYAEAVEEVRRLQQLPHP